MNPQIKILLELNSYVFVSLGKFQKVTACYFSFSVYSMLKKLLLKRPVINLGYKRENGEQNKKDNLSSGFSLNPSVF